MKPTLSDPRERRALAAFRSAMSARFSTQFAQLEREMAQFVREWLQECESKHQVTPKDFVVAVHRHLETQMRRGGIWNVNTFLAMAIVGYACPGVTPGTTNLRKD